MKTYIQTYRPIIAFFWFSFGETPCRPLVIMEGRGRHGKEAEEIVCSEPFPTKFLNIPLIRLVLSMMMMMMMMMMTTTTTTTTVLHLLLVQACITFKRAVS